MENISANITYAEAVKSQSAIRKGIDNTPTSEHLQAMKYLANHIFEPVRTFIGAPIGVSSFYRNPKVNKAIGGAASSQHCKGEAMDIDCDIFGNGLNSQVFDFIKNNLVYDQLIWEFGNDIEPDWVHVSLKNGSNRMQKLKATKIGGKTIYTVIQ